MKLKYKNNTSTIELSDIMHTGLLHLLKLLLAEKYKGFMNTLLKTKPKMLIMALYKSPIQKPVLMFM